MFAGREAVIAHRQDSADRGMSGRVVRARALSRLQRTSRGVSDNVYVVEGGTLLTWLG